MATVNLDSASRLDVVCRKGDSFRLALEFGQSMPTTVSEYSFQIANSNDEAAIAAATFSITVTDGDATDSLVTVTSAAATMAGITAGLYVYDLDVDDSAGIRFEAGDTKTLLYGTFKVVDDIGA